MLANNRDGGTAGFCCLPGLTEEDIAEVLAALPASLASPIPIVALGGRHAKRSGTLVLASYGLLRLCGVKNLDGLSRLLAGGEQGCSQSLAGLLANLTVDGAPAIERLRCRMGAVKRTFTLLCSKVSAGGAQPLCFAAVLDICDREDAATASESNDALTAVQLPARAGLRPAERASRRSTQRARASSAPGRETLEMELRRQKAEFRELSAILDTAMDGVAVLDSQGRILTLNRSGEALFGYDQDEVAGEPLTCLFAPESKALARDYFEGLKSHGTRNLLNQGCEVICLTRQGGTIPAFMTFGRIGTAGDPEDERFCALLRDLTHWKKVERDLEEARKEAERASALKSDFLARVSHEIRTPLNAILGFAEVMLDERFGAIGNERYKAYLGDIHTSGTLVMSLVNDLLDLAKIEAGKMDFAFASIDANRIVSECVAIMQPQASRERVAIRLSLSPALPNINADERSLRQIVLNVVSNAVKFNRPGGQVLVSTVLADSGSVVVRIRDTGVGMAEADIGLAFEPFRRLAAAAASRGTGLGLPLTKALVEANHASMIVKSKENEGTLVEVVFPPARVLAE